MVQKSGEVVGLLAIVQSETDERLAGGAVCDCIIDLLDLFLKQNDEDAGQLLLELFDSAFFIKRAFNAMKRTSSRHVSTIAKELGISRPTFYSRLKKHVGLPSRDFMEDSVTFTQLLQRSPAFIDLCDQAERRLTGRA
jgi:DNA-binding phage protein